MVRGVSTAIVLTLMMTLSSLVSVFPAVENPQLDSNDESLPTSSKALIIWSGTMDVNNDFTVAAGDELRIYPGTIIQMGPAVRIYVDGKVVADGTAADPITFQVQSGFTWHNGFQFNSSSRNRGSSLRNVTFNDAQFGITMYDSDPVIEDGLFNNVDLVAIDLFDGSNPVIRRTTFAGGGQDVHGSMTNWRYGIGLSIGANSAPFVEDVNFTNQITRAISYWGNSGGVIRGVNVTNVGGATMNISAAIFVEDSLPLIEDVIISKCDNGIYVIHATDSLITRPVFRNVVVGDSQYSAVMMTKIDRSNYSTYMMGRFHNLEVFGTGGPNSSSPGLAYGTVFLNTSGGWFEDVNIHDNTINGVKMYMTDPSTSFINTSIRQSGALIGGTNERAGFFMRSSNNGGPSIQNLTVSGSPGAGIFVSKGDVSGSGWITQNNGNEGLLVQDAFPSVSDILSQNNGFSGLRVSNSNRMSLQNFESRHNGYSAPSAQNGAGMVFVESNQYGMFAGTNVQCSQCSSIDDNWGALRVENSVDIQFVDLEVHDPNVVQGQSAIVIDDSNMNWDGWVDIDGAEIYANLSAGAPVITIDDTDARLEGINLYGNHSGIQWTGRTLDSKLGNSTLSGNNCLTISNIPKLNTWGLDVSGCTGSVSISGSDLNLTDYIQGGVPFSITGQSYVRAISSQVTIPILPPSATFDELWFVDMWVVNQFGHGLPNSLLNASFTQFENSFSMQMPYSGNEIIGPFVGTRTTIAGSSQVTDISTECWYDNTGGSTGPDTLNQDLMMYLCTITLVNQAPLIIWDVPLNNTVTSSGAEIWFNASSSWDLDNDPITFQWTSDIDGDTSVFCNPFMGGVVPGDLLVNGPNTGQGQGGCTLIDGEHQITLQVCDDQGNCASETRTILFVNLPPSVIVHTTPALDWDGVLRLNFTENLHVNASDTTDLEGDLVETKEYAEYEIPNAATFDLEWNRTFAGAPNRDFTYTMSFWDGLNPPVYFNISVEVQNEYPHPFFTVSRDSNLSQSEVTFDGSASFDPEGDEIDAWWYSDIDGDLNTSMTSPLIWTGHLSQGSHTIQLRLSDDDSYHINQWSTPFEVEVEVINSPPLAHIELPSPSDSIESADLVLFSAYGSGDWDAPCSEAFPEMSTGWLCNPSTPSMPDTVTPEWTSDLLSEPFGGDWQVEARLPSGTNVVTLTVSDGVNPPVTDSMTLEVSTSAPILVISSPADGIEVVSNEVVLFDPQQSWDPDGDNFTFSVTSNLLSEPMLDAVNPNFWYSRYVPSGDHILTFTVTDETGMSRNETRSLKVLASPPMAIISSPKEGETFSPGANILLNANESWDADEDIILYRWYLGQGASAELLNETEMGNQTLLPGTHLISLQLKDSRGASTWAFANITVEDSWPVLDDLLVEPGTLTAGVESIITARAFVLDADMTTWECVGWASQGGIETEFLLSDDGAAADGVASDSTWTGQVKVTPGRDGWMNIEVICRDGPEEEPHLSNRLSSTIKVDGASQQSSFFDVIMDSTVAIILGLLGLAVVSGVLYTFSRKRRLAADLQMIESWGVSGFGDDDDDDSSFDEDDDSAGLVGDEEPLDFTEEVDAEEVSDDDIPSMVELD
jgi:hypothetical protein